jgi:thioredoxin 1
MLEVVTKENFVRLASEGNTSGKLVVVDFYADWCFPCKKLKPVLEDLSQTMPEVKFLALNIEEHAEVAATYNIRSIPTLLCFRGGEVVETISGFSPRAVLEEKFRKHI